MMVSDKAQFYVVHEDGGLLGIVKHSDLRHLFVHREGLGEILLAEDLAHEGIPVCYPEESLSRAVVKFDRSGVSELPVVDGDKKRQLIGVVRYTKIFSRYNEEVMKLDSIEGFSTA